MPTNPDIVTTQVRALLDALRPVEWYTTDREDAVVVSLDGDTALRLLVTPVPLPAVSPYDSDDNRYPARLDEGQRLYVDATVIVPVPDARKTTTDVCVFGPFSDREEAERGLWAFMGRENALGAIIRNPQGDQ